MTTGLVGSLLPPAERPFGKYELISKLATGGMAEIFLARCPGDKARGLLVIKRILPHLVDDARFVAMFRDEARLATRIRHPNVCQVFDSGHIGNTYFIAMEYLEGVPLARILSRAARLKKPIPTKMAVGIMVQCCAGLHHAHNLTSRNGTPLDVVHRDISPPNIFVSSNGLAKVLDFGVAKARGATQKTRTGTVKGKNAYMSPEQILGEVVDRRSDIFSLGIVLWETLTAKRLFSRDTDFMTFTAITKVEIPDIREIRPSVPKELCDAINGALTASREDRYATILEFADALTQAVGGPSGYFSQEQLAKDLKHRFSRELEGKRRLTTRITEQLAAQTESEPRESPREEEPTMTSIEAVSVPSEERAFPQELSAPVAVDTMIIRRSDSNRGLLVALVVAVAVVSLGIGAWLFGGRNEAAPPDSGRLGGATGQWDASMLGAPTVADAQMVVPDAQGDPRVAVDAASGRTVQQRLPKRPGFLTVDSSPYATIYLDGKKLGVTPIFKERVPAGAHRLRAVSATGAVRYLRITVPPGKTKNLGRLKWK